MKQLFQNAKEKTIEIREVPRPAVRAGCLLVQNSVSVISPGTERSTVSAAKDSYLKTARNRPDLVERVVDLVKKEGVLAAYEKVQNKLSEPKALGYSSAGEVIAVGEGCGDWFRVGDRVACAGQGVASHAEVVCVPVNLAARVPEGVSLEDAAFTTIGAIALQGIRQGEPRFGERWAVIGLGLLGQITTQLLVANGVRVAAFDLEAPLAERARGAGAELALAGGRATQVARALAWSEGLGVDGVIITAASSSDAPMNAAGGMARDRARIVAVGAVPFGLNRAVAFSKELELRISRSYGPGRYDRGYEEKGFDYPAGYVRWTEARNLEAVLHAMKASQLSMGPLITHRVPLAEAVSAYDSLLDPEGERPLGMVLQYGEGHEAPAPAPAAASGADHRRGERRGPISGKVGVAFIGAGSFSRGTLLPKFSKHADVRMRRVVTARGLSAFDAQRRFGFEEAGGDTQAIFDDPAVDLVCVTTRHDAHAELVIRALGAGKHVFVEKPLALNEVQLQAVERAAAAAPGLLLTGFNRRFSPMAVALRRAVAGRGPVMATYRVNAGKLSNHWLQDPDFGGGRIVGEGCHFVDTLSYLAGDAEVVDVRAHCAGRARGLAEDVAVQIAFKDGSVGQMVYTAMGNTGMGKERVEVFSGGASGWIDNYNEATIYAGAKPQKVKATGKGHGEEIDALVAACKAGGMSPIPLEVMARVTRITFRIHRLLAGEG